MKIVSVNLILDPRNLFIGLRWVSFFGDESDMMRVEILLCPVPVLTIVFVFESLT